MVVVEQITEPDIAYQAANFKLYYAIKRLKYSEGGDEEWHEGKTLQKCLKSMNDDLPPPPTFSVAASKEGTSNNLGGKIVMSMLCKDVIILCYKINRSQFSSQMTFIFVFLLSSSLSHRIAHWQPEPSGSSASS